MTSDTGMGQKEWIALVRVEIHTQEIEDGYDLHDWDDRQKADIETVDKERGFRQLTTATKSELEGHLAGLSALEVANSG